MFLLIYCSTFLAQCAMWPVKHATSSVLENWCRMDQITKALEARPVVLLSAASLKQIIICLRFPTNLNSVFDRQVFYLEFQILFKSWAKLRKNMAQNPCLWEKHPMNYTMVHQQIRCKAKGSFPIFHWFLPLEIHSLWNYLISYKRKAVDSQKSL